MEIVNKSLASDADNWLLLGLEGWGFYKQGKYEDALKFLDMAEQKSLFFDFEVYLHKQEIEKVISGL